MSSVRIHFLAWNRKPCKREEPAANVSDPTANVSDPLKNACRLQSRALLADNTICYNGLNRSLYDAKEYFLRHHAAMLLIQ